MTTTTRPRPTRHQLDELTGRLNAAITCAEERLDQITTLTEHRDEQLRAQMAKLRATRDHADPEARALAECVKALDTYQNRPLTVDELPTALAWIDHQISPSDEDPKPEEPEPTIPDEPEFDVDGPGADGPADQPAAAALDLMAALEASIAKADKAKPSPAERAAARASKATT